ncbi:amino acid adenylation domain-containing protein, partial [Rhodanobacter sp. MP1X3]|uniref:amino acid adenylation domain-containing protein n=1 Tax=Rhodanobacter sp. MP1X3 TaxID=2723086 RepID=UPI00180436E8|nr:amino acid adenylation domain-containing protein [Rhodanobacter sp. MP1X3]
MPASYAQERLWFVDQLEGGSTQYIIQSAYRLKGVLDNQALERALNAIVDRHEVLRSRLQEEGGSISQVIEGGCGVPVNYTNLTALNPATQMSRIEVLLREDAEHTFDLARDTLLRVRVCVLGIDDHVMSFDMHHIVSDGWSLAVLASEFCQLYAAFCHGATSPLAALPVQYGDYAVWQRNWLTKDLVAKQLAFWNGYLDGLPQAHRLPLDRQRQPRQTYRGRRNLGALDAKLVGGIHVLCQRYGATPFMLLETAFAIALGWYAREKDIVVGMPIAGRLNEEVESLIGLFVNTLVIRTEVDLEADFETLLSANRASILDALNNQHVPFEAIVEAIKPKRSLAHTPLFQVLFNMNGRTVGSVALPDLTMEPIWRSEEVSKFDLELNATEHNGVIQLVWIYNVDLFDAGTIESLAGSFETLLRAVVSDPGQRILDLPLVDAEQRERVLVMGEGPVGALPEVCLVHEAFERSVRQSPTAVAARMDKVSLTYAELDAKANQLAHYLGSIGLGRGTRVGIYLHRSIEQLIGVLGVLKAGGMYVPLEPSHPQERTSYIIKDAGIELVLVEQSLVSKIPLGGFDILTMDGASNSAQWLGEYPSTAPVASEVQDSDAAYILYTSGSTGRPKGVEVPHRSAWNYLEHAAQSYLPDGLSGAVVSSPLCFDATLTTFLAPLFVARPMVILTDDATTLDALGEYLFGAESWLFKITPAHLDALQQKQVVGRRSERAHVIVIGGEQLSAATLLDWQELLPQATFVNEYGPTETVVGCSTYTVAPGTARTCLTGRTAVPIGQAIRNTQLRVLNAAMQPQPVNCAGELYIGGAGVAAGYVNLAQETQAKFLADPYGQDGSQRLYRTGDLVRWLADGNLEFLGRTDDQVKIRGYRIELGEIEGQLRQVPGVTEAAVLMSTGAGLNEDARLMAYIVAEGVEASMSMQERAEFGARCRARLSEMLPDYMVPSAFVVLDAMPLTPNGKLDRKALPALSADFTSLDSYVAPVNTTEARLCAIWESLLRVERVGTYDHFFDLGGHSLLALRLLSRIRNEFGVELSLSALFESPTVASLAQQLVGEAQSPLPSIEKRDDDEELPLSFAQKRLWFLSQLGEASAAYHIPAALR